MDAVVRLGEALAGRYRIDREIGAGGMATVYLARDLKHDRQVALKVLKPELGAVIGAERFLAEIKVTAHLQHPNLLPLFDSGEAAGLLYYVMPYVEDESLRHRLAREKQLPVYQALQIALAITSALDYAHRKGVIHRDLKPENILLHEGQPLIADFGIALAVSNAGGERLTQTGLSLGTPHYMSPEQATGDRVIDGRSDIYSLGALLYEMLTGDPPHTGSTAQAVIARVLTDRPRSVRATRASVPVHMAAAVERALEKLPADRFTSAQEFGDALRGRAVPAPVLEPHAAATRASRRAPVMMLALAGLALVASLLAVWGWLRPAAPNAPVRFPITLPPDIALHNVYALPMVSRDGHTVFARAQVGSRIMLVKQRLDSLDVRPLPGTEDVGVPVVSPDDRWIAFFANGQLRKVPVDGGPATSIAPTAIAPGIDWAPNNELVLGTFGGGLRRVPAAGGALQPLTQLDTARGEAGHAWPRVLPDGNTVVYVSWPGEGLAGARLAVTTLSSGGAESRLLDVNGTSPLGLVEGHLLYVRADGSLMAVPFDMRKRETTGPAIALMGGIYINRAVGASRVALSEAGTLLYMTFTKQLVVKDLAGGERLLTTDPANFDTPRWSPDGRQIAVSVSGEQGTNISLYDIASGALSPLITDGINPSWTFDGKRVVYISTRDGRQSIWWRLADGSTPAEMLYEVPGDRIGEALLAPDNHTLVYSSSTARETYSVDLTGNRTPERVDPRRVTQHLALSPDGKWLTYLDPAARQVAVRPFPGPGAATHVSEAGGEDAVWSHDGRHMYYLLRRQVMAIDFTPGPVPVIGNRRVLFEGPYMSLGGGGPASMSVSPDGRQFVLLREGEEGAQLIVVLNWITELRARLGPRTR
jgi:serine/threonine-protein kinase